MNLTMALERYDRHFPFFDGTVKVPDGVKLKALQVGQGVPLRDGKDRHGRMLRGEFDLAEFSMSTYLMAIDRKLPITGVPVFPRRLFSPGLWYVRGDSKLSNLAELAGKRVAIRSFQTTLSLLAKGDLKFEYGLPWEEVHWFVEDEEKIPFDPKPNLKIEHLPKGVDIGHLLNEGRVDAAVLPHPPPSIMSHEVPVRRLLRDPDGEELKYYKKYGYFPIMHIIAVRKKIAESEPWLPTAIMTMFSEARKISDDYFTDPNWSSLAFGRRYFEREKEMFGADIWQAGLSANRANLDRFILYSRDQGLISGDLAADDLFPESLRTT